MTAPADSLRDLLAVLERGGVDSATWFALRERFDELTAREGQAPKHEKQREREAS